MKLDELNLSALQARHGKADASPKDGASPLAWRREMEKAQADAWFHGALHQPKRGQESAPTSAPPAARDAVSNIPSEPHPRSGTETPARPMRAPSARADAPRDMHAAMPATVPPTLSTTVAVPGAVARPGSATFTVIADDAGAPIASQPQAAVPVDREAEAPAQAETLPPDAPDSQARSAARRSEGSRLPVRVHIEGDAQQATVWLGVDAAAHTQLPAVTEAIGRWLAQAGYGVPTWICNGQRMSEPAGAAAETPVESREPLQRDSPSDSFPIDQHQGVSP